MDASGWYSTYYMGFMEFIFETYGREPFKEIMFTGVSGGGHAAGYSIATVHGPAHKTLRYWLPRGQQLDCGINMYTCGWLTRGCYISGYTYYNTCEEDGITHHINDKYFSISTNMFGEMVTCGTPESADDFGRLVATTSNVPIIGSLFPLSYRGIYLWDGLIAWIWGRSPLRTDVASVYSDKSNLIFTMMSDKKFVPQTNVHVINIRKLAIKPIPSSLIQTMMPSFMSSINAQQFCGMWFDIGYESAKTNHLQYKDKIEKFILDGG